MEEKENLNETENIELDNNSDNTENLEMDKNDFIAKLNNDLLEQKKKTDEYFEHLKRNMAEFDNFKKRMSKEKDTMYSTIISGLVADFLLIVDNFEKAMQAETSDESFKSGIEMIYIQTKDALKKLGLEEIEALNAKFDPELHEAVMHIEDENYGEKEVVEEFRKGYKIGDKVIRHSMVKVAN